MSCVADEKLQVSQKHSPVHDIYGRRGRAAGTSHVERKTWAVISGWT